MVVGAILLFVQRSNSCMVLPTTPYKGPSCPHMMHSLGDLRQLPHRDDFFTIEVWLLMVEGALARTKAEEAPIPTQALGAASAAEGENAYSRAQVGFEPGEVR